MNFTTRLLPACLGGLFTVAAWADCVTREPTARESEFHKIAVAALPGVIVRRFGEGRGQGQQALKRFRNTFPV